MLQTATTFDSDNAPAKGDPNLHARGLPQQYRPVVDTHDDAASDGVADGDDLPLVPNRRQPAVGGDQNRGNPRYWVF